MDRRQIFAPANLVGAIAKKNYRIARIAKGRAGDVLERIDDAEHSDDRRRMHAAGRALVIERDISACDRCVQRDTGLANSRNGFPELEEYLRAGRISEVETVGDSERACTGACDVARGFDDGNSTANSRIERDVTTVAIGLERDGAIGATNAQHRCVPARSDHGIRSHRRIVLLVRPTLARDGRGGEKLKQRPRRVAFLRQFVRCGDVDAASRDCLASFLRGNVVARTLGYECGAGEFRNDTISLGHAVHGLLQ